MLQPGDTVDRYIVEAHIGQGGMASVYRVRHATLGTRHALKVLQVTNPDIVRRTIQEGQVQARLRHRHVVSVTDVFDINGSPGLLMEYVHGPALDHWLFQYQPPYDEVLTVFRGIVAGVGYAHSKGLIHRDLKTANVMLQLDDELGVVPKVTDFGLAKVNTPTARNTRSGTTMGTPTYMAPEQIRDASTVDRRADLYSLGCILYELVCGRTPHVGDDVIELFSEVASGRYPHPREFRSDVPNPIVDCIEGLVEVNRSYRLQDCAAILELLDTEGAKNTFSLPEMDEHDGLPPPNPMPDPGVSILPHDSPGGLRAARFASQLSTPPLVPPDPGSSARVADFDNSTVSLNVDEPAPTPSPAPRRRGLLVGALMLGPMALFGGMGLGALVLGLGLAYRASRVEEVHPTPDVAPVGEPAPPPTAPEPAPVAAPEPQPTAPSPTPAVEPRRASPSPLPMPATAPVQEQPIAPSKPSPVASGTSWSIVGAESVSLHRDEKAYGVKQLLEPGEYQVMAVFEAGEAPLGAGTVRVADEASITIECRAAFQKCKKK